MINFVIATVIYVCENYANLSKQVARHLNHFIYVS